MSATVNARLIHKADEARELAALKWLLERGRKAREKKKQKESKAA